MMSKQKFFVFIVMVIVLMSSCCAYAEGLKLGMLASGKLVVGDAKTTQDMSDIVVWSLNSPRHGEGESSFRFYNNFVSMLMALNAGEINEFATSQVTGEYITAVNPQLKICCAARIPGSSFVFGFREREGEALRDKFNAALAEMRHDGTLEALRLKYCGNPGKDRLDSVKLERFPDDERVRVAVTGDVPPLDFVAADGEPAGFNTAILAEIGRRQRLNIEPVYIETAARTPALVSGRVECVFWYQIYKDAKEQPDAPEGVIFSAPYYDFNVTVHVGLK